MFPTHDLHAAVAAVCPIDGVSVGRANDRATWKVHPKPEATPQQIEAAQRIFATWQPSVPKGEPDMASQVAALSERLSTLTAALSALAQEARK